MRVGGLWGRGLFIGAGGVAIGWLIILGPTGWNDPVRHTATQETLRPGINFRPAAGPAWTSGCTVAPIDRSSGQTVPVDCPASASNTATLTARLAEPAPR